MKNELISVVIPTYNRKEVLRETLNRIFCQDFEGAYEIILVDDCSTDGTEELISAMHLPAGMKYFKNTSNLGRARTRNLGIGNASGDIIVMIDDDIWVEKDFLRKHCRMHVINEDVVVVGSVLPSYDLQGTFFNKFLSRRYEAILERMRSCSADLPYYFFRTGNVSLKKAVLEKAGPFDENFCLYGGEDTELGYSLKKSGYKLLHEEIVGWHNYDADLNYITSKAYQKGRSSYYLVQKHPELFRDMQFHSVFFEKSADLKNALKYLFYSAPVVLSFQAVLMIASISNYRPAPVMEHLLGLLEWQCFAKGARDAGKSAG
ncbi:MAG: glycosyltransferase [Candidatus Margulisbacteria bacterium]|nr:glycosyltransferase [Candidatus Margulisiibacteriota bacterium]